MGVVDLIRALRSEPRCPRILVLSVHPERHYARRVLQAGADGYLTKSNSPSASARGRRAPPHTRRCPTASTKSSDASEPVSRSTTSQSSLGSAPRQRGRIGRGSSRRRTSAALQS
jgi:DNA-binding NarL/FixJ family response regulator